MINISFNWAWLPIAAIVVFAIIIAAKIGLFKNDTDDKLGIKHTFGCIVIIIGVLIAAVIGGIFIW